MRGSLRWGPAIVMWDGGAPAAMPPDLRLAALGPAQLARYDALDGAAAERFARGRMLVADVIEHVTGSTTDLAITTTCERCGAEHGRIRHVSGRVALSVSYTDGQVVVAGVDTTLADVVGVDAERDTAEAHRRVAELGPLFSPAPPPTLAEWTKIEAVLKADGRALRVAPADVVFDHAAGTATVARRRGDIEVATLDGPSGYLLSVAVAR